MRIPTLGAVALALVANSHVANSQATNNPYTNIPYTYEPDGVEYAFTSISESMGKLEQALASSKAAQLVPLTARLFEILPELGEAIKEADAGITGLDSSDFNSEQESRVCSAMDDFLDKAIALVDTMIGPKSKINKSPLLRFAGAGLKTPSNAIEALVHKTAKLVPSCAEAAEKKLAGFTKDVLDGFIRQNIQTKATTKDGQVSASGVREGLQAGLQVSGPGAPKPGGPEGPGGPGGPGGKKPAKEREYWEED